MFSTHSYTQYDDLNLQPLNTWQIWMHFHYVIHSKYLHFSLSTIKDIKPKKLPQ